MRLGSVPATAGPAAAGLPPARDLRATLREIVAGASVGCIMLPFCVTAGVLAYEPLGPDRIGTGAAAGILCGVAGGLAAAFARSSSFIPNLPPVGMAIIQASFVSTLMATSGGDAGTALALMPLSIAMTGLCQILIAVSGLAKAVKFTPYPVLAGFVTGLAVLTFVQQLPRLFDVPSLGALVASLVDLSLPSPAMPLFGIAVLVLIRLSERFAPRLPSALVGLVAGTLAWHGLEAVWPHLALGKTIGSVSLADATHGVTLDWATLRHTLGDRTTLQSLLLTSLTIGLLGTLDYTFAFRSAQNLGGDLPMRPRRDLAGQGISNIVSAVAGGLAVTSSLAFAQTNFASGGRTRISTIAAALMLLAVALAAPSLIAALPVVVLSAILVAISVRMWDRWCWSVARDMVRAEDRAARVRARRNGLIVAAVMAATVLGQPVVGALAGIVVSCLVFIVEMSRPAVDRRRHCGQIASKRIRSQHEVALLRSRGPRTAVLDLQGVLFFGNADDLASEIKAIEGAADQVILDLRRVTDLDTSGATVLQQIAARCSERGMRLVLCGAHESYRDLLDAALSAHGDVLVLPDLDAALECAEDQVLADEGSLRAGWTTLALHETDLAGGLSEDELACLTGHLTACSYPAGTALCRAGEPADKLWLITRGCVSVRLAGAHHGRRVAGLGPGTSVGEMGLLDRQPRSADVVADEDVEAYVLGASDFDALMREEPRLGQSILATIARLTAQRLRATSDELRLAET